MNLPRLSSSADRPESLLHRRLASAVTRAWALAIISAISGLLAVSDTHAAVRLWTGNSATSGNWTTAANWDSGAPQPGDVLSFTANGLRKTSNTNNFPAGTTFSTINVFGTGWRLRGNSVTISNYVTAGNPAGTNIIDNDLIAAGPGVGITLSSFNSAARLTLNGDLNLGARNLHTEGPGDFVVAGVISGSAGIFKDNSGDLTLAGLGPNTFLGSTVVAAGVLRLGRYNLVGGLNVVGTTAIPGDLVIGGGNSTLVGNIAALQLPNQIANTSTVYVNQTGSLELSDEDETVGELQLRGGTVTTGTGTLSVAGTIFAAVPIGVSKDSVIAGRLNLGGRGAGPQIIDVAQNIDLNITAEVIGTTTSPLVKTNRGDLWLTRSNAFAGDVQIDGGAVYITDPHALGTTNGVTKPVLGQLNLSGTFGINETLEVPGPAGTMAVISGNPAWLGNIVLDDDLFIIVPTNSTLSVIGAISGPAGWQKVGDGTLQFKTAYTNSYAGLSWVREGNLIMDGVFNQPVIPGPLVIGLANDPTNTARVWPIKQNQIADTAPVTLNHSGVLSLGIFDDTVGPLIFNGGAVETAGGTLTLNGDILVNATNETARMSGKLSLGGATRTIQTVGTSSSPDLLIASVISDGGAPAGLAKTGAGSVRLTGANTYTGTTTVADGRLEVNGSIATSAGVRLNEPLAPNLSPTAVLAGTGAVASVFAYPAASVAPGLSPGRLTVQGNTVLTNGQLQTELNGLIAGASYDQLRVNGAVTLSGCQLTVLPNFTPPTNVSFVIVDKTSPGPVSGTFLNAPEGAVLAAGPQQYRITYLGGDGNDVALSRVDPAAVFSTPVPSINGNQIQIQGQGAPFAIYILEAAPHLVPPVPWQPIATNAANASGVYQFADPFADNGAVLRPAQYYRVVAP